MKKVLFLPALLCIFIFSCNKEANQDDELYTFSGSEKVKYTYEEFKMLSTCDKLTFGTWHVVKDSINLESCYRDCGEILKGIGIMHYKPISKTLRIEGDKRIYPDKSTRSLDTSFVCDAAKFLVYPFQDAKGKIYVTGYLKGELINDTTLSVYGITPWQESTKPGDATFAIRNEVFYTLVLRSDHLIK
ncbi:hypothetical protein [Owenweeksia hongkongensis]|uniref:hypothetical protein n=1 Tax=Owenweeksia hongkongensis TaxID=253245 RepID=UPI003A9188DC